MENIGTRVRAGATRLKNRIRESQLRHRIFDTLFKGAREVGPGLTLPPAVTKGVMPVRVEYPFTMLGWLQLSSYLAGRQSRLADIKELLAFVVDSMDPRFRYPWYTKRGFRILYLQFQHDTLLCQKSVRKFCIRWDYTLWLGAVLTLLARRCELLGDAWEIRPAGYFEACVAAVLATRTKLLDTCSGWVGEEVFSSIKKEERLKEGEPLCIHNMYIPPTRTEACWNNTAIQAHFSTGVLEGVESLSLTTLANQYPPQPYLVPMHPCIRTEEVLGSLATRGVELSPFLVCAPTVLYLPEEELGWQRRIVDRPGPGRREE